MYVYILIHDKCNSRLVLGLTRYTPVKIYTEYSHLFGWMDGHFGSWKIQVSG